jgi:putative membrane protein
MDSTHAGISRERLLPPRPLLLGARSAYVDCVIAQGREIPGIVAALSGLSRGAARLDCVIDQQILSRVQFFIQSNEQSCSRLEMIIDDGFGDAARAWNRLAHGAFAWCRREIPFATEVRIMKLSTMLVIAALCTASAVATAQQSSATTTNRTTGAQSETTGERMGDRKGGDKISAEEFAKKAGAAGMAEVEMGKLGAQKATDPDVKAYAQKMVTDHTKANKELMAAAKGKNIEVPTEPDMLHKGMMEKFQHQKADKDFNHDYMQFRQSWS